MSNIPKELDKNMIVSADAEGFVWYDAAKLDLYGFAGIDDWKGCQDAYLKFMPILNAAKIDLMISGHTHRLHYAPAQPDDNRYPVLEQGHKNATRLDLSDGNIRISVRNAEGKEVFSQTIER